LHKNIADNKHRRVWRPTTAPPSASSNLKRLKVILERLNTIFINKIYIYSTQNFFAFPTSPKLSRISQNFSDHQFLKFRAVRGFVGGPSSDEETPLAATANRRIEAKQTTNKKQM